MSDYTHNVKLWIDNDYGLYTYWSETAQEILDNLEEGDDKTNAITELSDRLKQDIEDNNPLSGKSDMYSDLLTNALNEVDFYDIAKDIIECIDEA